MTGWIGGSYSKHSTETIGQAQHWPISSNQFCVLGICWKNRNDQSLASWSNADECTVLNESRGLNWLWWRASWALKESLWQLSLWFLFLKANIITFLKRFVKSKYAYLNIFFIHVYQAQWYPCQINYIVTIMQFFF